MHIRAHRDRILLLFILLLAFALRIYRLDAQSLWGDENLSLRYAESPAHSLKSMWTPPLYYVSLHYWMAPVGSSDFAIRFLSLIFSWLTVPLIYHLGRLLFDHKVGWLAALVTSINPYQIWYGQEARSYSMVVCLGVASVILLVMALRENRRHLWILYTIITALSIYCNYEAFLIVLSEGVFVAICWLGRRYRDRALYWLATQAVIGILYLPWISVAWKIQHYEAWWEPISPLYLLWRLLTVFSLGTSADPTVGFWFILGFALILSVGLLAIGCKLSEEGKREGALVGLLYLFVPLGVALFYVLVKEHMLERYLIVVAPAYYLVLGCGLSLLSQRWYLWGGSVFFVALGSALSLQNYYFDPYFWRGDYRGAARHIMTFGHPGDAVIFDGIEPELFLRYYHGDIPLYTVDEETSSQLLPEIAAGHSRLWVLLENHPPGPIERWLTTEAYQTSYTNFSSTGLILYALPSQGTPSPVTEPAALHLAESVTLVGYSLPPQPVASGDVAQLTLLWQPHIKLQGNSHISVRLLDEKGHMVLQRDRQPVDGFSPTFSWSVGKVVIDRYGLLIPPGLMPGTYLIETVMYDPNSNTDLVRATVGSVNVSRDSAPLPLEALAIPHLQQALFPPGLELLGHDIPDVTARSGEEIPVTLFWRALEEERSDVKVLLQLRDRKGQVWAELKAPHDRYPISQWAKRETRLVIYDLAVNAATPTGKYRLFLNVLDEATNEPLSPADIYLATVPVEGRKRRFSVPRDIAYPQKATLGQGVIFLGYDLAETVVPPDGVVHLKLYWQAGQRMSTDYTVFTHLLGTDNRIVGQQDNMPQAWTAPTTSWLEGEVLIDEYSINVKPDAAPGEYHLEIGMYDAATGQRLPAYSEEQQRLMGDCILLDQAITIQY
jgi:mannosyltransferase